MERITILLADDHAVIRDGLRRILATEPDMEVVGEAGNGTEAVALSRQLQPKVVLMDIRMPELDGILATRYLKESCPDTTVIILTMFDRDEYLFQAVREGAAGYILKDVPGAEVVKAIRAGARGESLLHPSVARRLMQGFSAISSQLHGSRMASEKPTLSPRELEVLRLAGLGRSNKAIAQALFISERTVKKHIGEILRTLGATTRTEAVITALQRGLIKLEDPAS